MELRGALRSAVTSRQWTQERKHAARLVDDAACRLCMAPVGSLQHRSVACPCHEDLRRLHAPHAVKSCMGDVRRVGSDLHWFTRALQPTKAYQVPAASSEPTFVWVVLPPDCLLAPAWTIYTDGSLLDGPSPLLRRTGWAFAALDAEGVVRASECHLCGYPRSLGLRHGPCCKL